MAVDAVTMIDAVTTELISKSARDFKGTEAQTRSFHTLQVRLCHFHLSFALLVWSRRIRSYVPITLNSVVVHSSPTLHLTMEARSSSPSFPELHSLSDQLKLNNDITQQNKPVAAQLEWPQRAHGAAPVSSFSAQLPSRL
jgi:hypothetical protein